MVNVPMPTQQMQFPLANSTILAQIFVSRFDVPFYACCYSSVDHCAASRQIVNRSTQLLLLRQRPVSADEAGERRGVSGNHPELRSTAGPGGAEGNETLARPLATISP